MNILLIFLLTKNFKKNSPCYFIQLELSFVFCQQAGTQFKTSLAQLMDILMSKEPSYVRCIKPNDFKRARKFLCSSAVYFVCLI